MKDQELYELKKELDDIAWYIEDLLGETVLELPEKVNKLHDKLLSLSDSIYFKDTE